MTAVPSYFNDFLSATRLSAALRATCSAKHLELRQLLRDDPALAAIIIDAFLQGSYRRDTIVRPLDPTDPNAHVDVDLVVVTTLDPEEYSPDNVVARFTPFLERNFPNHWRPNDRSIQLTYDGTPVTLDLVVTAAPSEVVREAVIKAAEIAGRRVNGLPTLSNRALPLESDILSLRQSVAKSAQLAEGDAWKEDYLLIPDRELRRWEPTHPIEQIAWTQRKNATTSGHYINVVKAVKWWRLRNNVPKHPKGYPLEHCVGTVCPDEADLVKDVVEVLAPPGVGQLVEHRDSVAVLAQALADERRADEARTPADQEPHVALTCAELNSRRPSRQSASTGTPWRSDRSTL